jgi:hypothetical protein
MKDRETILEQIRQIAIDGAILLILVIDVSGDLLQ